MMNDTIAAIATRRGRAAIGIVRVSGPAVRDLACALLGELPPPLDRGRVGALKRRLKGK